MLVRNRILDLLKAHPDGLDDDVVAEKLRLAQRQQANARCRELEGEGLVERRSIGGKIRNFLADGLGPTMVRAAAASQIQEGAATKPWSWEGNVVGALTRHLIDRGWTMETIADTETSQSGADIRATREGQILIVEAKGYPSKVYERGLKKGQPKRTNPATQARHWVGEAILTALLRQSESPEYHVAIAFPEFAVYTKLPTRIRQSLRKLGLIVLVIRESGAVVLVQDEDQVLERVKPA